MKKKNLKILFHTIDKTNFCDILVDVEDRGVAQPG